MFRLEGMSAGRVALIVAAFLIGSSADLAAQDTENPYTSLEDVETGERLFRIHCSRCHGIDAAGDDGPSLRRGRFRRAQSDTGLFRVISEGVANTGMPPIFRRRTDRSVWQVVAYLRSINQRPEDLSLPGDVVVGQRLYAGAGECATCHMISGVGSLLGPDLTFVGDQRSPDELRADLLDPNHEVAPRWWSVQVTYADGRKLEGLRMNEDTYSFRLLDADERLWSVTKRDLSESRRIEASTMPNYDKRFTVSEVDNLIAYLFSLRTGESAP